VRSGRTPPMSIHSLTPHHISARLLTNRFGFDALPPNGTSMTSYPSCRSRSMTPAPAPLSMNTASGSRSSMTLATAAARLMLSMPVNTIGGSMRSPWRRTMTLRSSPNRAGSTPMTSGNSMTSPSAILRSLAAVASVRLMSWSSPAAAKSQRYSRANACSGMSRWRRATSSSSRASVSWTV